jgi:uncharacterized protein YukE
MLEHATRLDGFTPRVEATESKFYAEFATSNDQLEATLSGLSNLRQEMQHEVADLRMAWQGHGQAPEAFNLAVLRDMEAKSEGTALELNNLLKNIEAKSAAMDLELNNRFEDMEAKNEGTALQLKEWLIDNETQNKATSLQTKEAKDRLDGIVSQVLALARGVDCLNPRVEAVETKLSAQLASSQGQVEATLSGLSNLRQEMQNEVAELRMVCQGHGQATEAFKSALLKDMEAQNKATSDEKIKQLKHRLDGLVSQTNCTRSKSKYLW